MVVQQSGQNNELHTASSTRVDSGKSKAVGSVPQGDSGGGSFSPGGDAATGEHLFKGLSQKDWDDTFKGFADMGKDLIKTTKDGLVRFGDYVLPGLEINHNEIRPQDDAAAHENRVGTLSSLVNDASMRDLNASMYDLPAGFTREAFIDAMGIPPEQVAADIAPSPEQHMVAITRATYEHVMRLSTGLPDNATDQAVRERLGLDGSASASQAWHALGLDRDGNIYHEQSIKALGMPVGTSDAQLKGALGLPYQATDREVFEAVQKKLYERDTTGQLNLLEKEATSPVGETDQERFQRDVLESEEPVLLVFTAPWNTPAKNMDSSLDRIAADNPGVKVMKVNVDNSIELAQRYGISSVPTNLIFQGGQVVDRQTGVRYAATLQADLERSIKD